MDQPKIEERAEAEREEMSRTRTYLDVENDEMKLRLTGADEIFVGMDTATLGGCLFDLDTAHKVATRIIELVEYARANPNPDHICKET